MSGRIIYIVLLIAVAASIIFLGCEKHIPNSSDFDQTGGNVTIGDTSYVEIYPPWGGFETPGALCVGNDQLIYVTDYDRNEVVMMDAGGTVLARRSILHPIAIAQNLKLDLYIGGEIIAPNGTDTVGAIFRINLVRFDTTYVSHIDTVINTTGDTIVTVTRRDTSYFYNHQLETAPMKVVWQEPARPQRRFTGIGILPDNSYLVARSGPDNSSFVDPDSRVLRFNKRDILETPLADLVTRPSGGTAITDIKNLTGLMVFPGSSDFILTQTSQDVAYGAIWMVYTSNNDFQGWLPRFDPSRADQRGIDFIRRDRFVSAVNASFDRRRREIFILDTDQDSVFKFNRNGQFRTESFGKARTTGSGFPGLNKPRGIAFSGDCTLYIADTGNKIVRRFKLSTQTSCN